MKTAIAGMLIGAFICSTAAFQRFAYPEEYREKEARNIELAIQFVAEEARISELRGDIEDASVLNEVLRGLDGDIAENIQNSTGVR